MEIYEIIPNLEKIRICWGRRYPEEEEEEEEASLEDIFITEGIPAKQCVIVYKNYNRNQVIEQWKEKGFQWIHLSGGWSNPMTPELNLYPSLAGDVKFKERKIKHVIQGLRKQRPPIYFNYIDGWNQILEKKRREFSEELKIGELLSLGAPSYWGLRVGTNEKDKFLARSTSTPFPGTEDDPGFLIVTKKPFKGVDLGISNTTGSRGLGTTGLNYFSVFLRNSREETEKVYIQHAEKKAEKMEEQGKEPYYNVEEIPYYAAEFLNSAELVKEDLREILKKYTSEEVIGIQYAVRQYIADGLPSAINRFPKVQPYCFVLTKKGWELAV